MLHPHPSTSWPHPDADELVGLGRDEAIAQPKQFRDQATYDKPHQYSVGVRDVVVNGKLVLRNDQVTAERPGRVLYGPAHQ